MVCAISNTTTSKAPSRLLIAGFYISGPVWGRIIDARGPRIPLIGAAACVFIAYAGTKRIYDDGIGTSTSLSPVLFALLVVLAMFIGFGANAGLNSGVNTTAKSFPESAVRILPRRRRGY